MAPLRTAALLLGLGILCLLGGGCGGGDATEETTSAAKEPAIEKSDAADYARAVNLRASDVPYFEAVDDEDEEEDPEAEEKREHDLQRCVGAKIGAAEDLASVDSPSFESQFSGGFLEVASSVSVGADPDQVTREAKLLLGPAGERCLHKFLLAALKEQETPSTEAGGSSLKRIPSPAPGIDGSFAFRFTTTITVHEDTSARVAYRLAGADPSARTLDIYFDLLGFVDGRTSVTLIAVGAPAPVSKNLERNLLRLLHERAASKSP